MTMSQDKRGSGTAASFRISPVAIGCTLLIAATGAMAQQQQPQQLETVTVTGIRKGIEDAISVKRNSDSIVEAISAEDIGKLPDTSIAESIARLPGVAAQRNAATGRASGISVRGFSPDFATSLLNGREQVSTGDSRYVEYDQYPSELMSGVTLYKTPDAGLVGQGLSGTVNMESARPLNFATRVVALNYRDEKLGKGLSTPAGNGSRINLAYIDQFADRTIGVALGFARLKETLGVQQNFGSWGINDVCPVGNNNGCPVATLGKAPGGFNDLVDSGTQKRDAFMGTLQYKPNKNFNSTLDVFYTKFDQTQLEQGAQIPLAPAFPEWGQNYGGTTVTPTTVTGGVITAGSLNGFKAVSRNDVNANHDKVHSIGWNNQLVMGDWTGVLDLATSEAKRNAPHLETTAGLTGNCKANPALCGSVSWTGFDGSSVQSAKYTFPYALDDVSKIKLTDVEGWGGGPNLPQAGYSKVAATDDKLNSFRLSAKRSLGDGFFSDMDLGFNYSDRKKTRTYVEGRLLVAAASDPFAGVAVPGGAAAVGPQTGTPYVAWNPDGSIGSVYTIAAKLVPDIANKNWVVTEKVATAYAKFGLDTTLGGIPVRGNAGAQLVHTDQSSTAFSADRTAACPGDVCALGTNTLGKKYYDILPSMNLVGDLGNGNTLRFALARQLARPTLDDMRASLDFNVNGTSHVISGNGGNPELKPFRATALDLSYEKYWGKQAYVSVAGFYKKLSSYILRVPQAYDFSPYITANTPPPLSPVGLRTAPVNGDGGNISGMELAASLPLNIVTSWLDGFGLQANYARTHSSLTLPSSGFNSGLTTPSISMPGLSKETRGWALYFEKWGFEARVGQRYRTDFVGSISDQYGDSQLIYIKAERVTDAQVSYNFQDGWLKGLTLLLQANNVNNEPYTEYKQSRLDPSTNRKYGKTYLMGVNYKF
jgi:iron complex outermembrane recepter protein